MLSNVDVYVEGLRLLWEVSGVSPGSVSSCVELLHQGHIIAIAPGSSQCHMLLRLVPNVIV